MQWVFGIYKLKIRQEQFFLGAFRIYKLKFKPRLYLLVFDTKLRILDFWNLQIENLIKIIFSVRVFGIYKFKI